MKDILPFCFVERKALAVLHIKILEGFNHSHLCSYFEASKGGLRGLWPKVHLKYGSGQSAPSKACDGDFPGGTPVKNPPANAGDTGSSPGPGRCHMLRSS